MKRSLLVFIIAGLVLLSTGMWFITSKAQGKPFEWEGFVIILLLIAFAVFIGIRRLTSERRGEPVEDELSKKVLQKTAALSYYISLYMWVAMIYIKDRVKLDTEEILGAGILGMAVIFAVCWLFFHFKGVSHE
jgi:peptidoglycan/LPS O-acetylase OafA/YrhL